jgi:hypothetical protein
MKIVIMLAGVVLLLAGCGQITTPLGELRQHPAMYTGKTVAVQGVVTDGGTIPLVGTRYYTLKDDTGQVTVIASGNLPKVGATVHLRARLRSAAELVGVQFGLHLVEVEN